MHKYKNTNTGSPVTQPVKLKGLQSVHSQDPSLFCSVAPIHTGVCPTRSNMYSCSSLFVTDARCPPSFWQKLSAAFQLVLLFLTQRKHLPSNCSQPLGQTGVHELLQFLPILWAPVRYDGKLFYSDNGNDRSVGVSPIPCLS